MVSPENVLVQAEVNKPVVKTAINAKLDLVDARRINFPKLSMCYLLSVINSVAYLSHQASTLKCKLDLFLSRVCQGG